MKKNRKIFDHLVRVSPVGLENHFKEHKSDIGKKRGTELLTGCILSRTFEMLDGNSPDIVIPMKKHTDIPPTVAEIIANPSLHLDDDVDLYLKISDSKAHPVQVTELEEHYSGQNCSEGLVRLIKKKSKRSQNKDLILAVIADLNGVLNLHKVREELELMSCPFGYIFLLGQFGNNVDQCIFSCQMLYPRFLDRIDVQLNL